MVFHGEYDRRYDQASLVSSIFTFPMSQRLVEQEPRGISSDLVVQQNPPANSHICAHPCVRDGPVMQDTHRRYALSRSPYHRCLVHPTLQEDTSMRRRRKAVFIGLRRDGTLPVCHAPNYPRQGGGRHGTEI